MNKTIKKIALSLENGSIGIIPTDTQYGIVTSALKPESVEKIYSLRKRSSEKPMIILISQVTDVLDIGLRPTKEQLNLMQKVWPNPVSLILPVTKTNLIYLHRGKKSLAFRIPAIKWLKELLDISGPLVAPSANFEGEKPATTIDEAKNYFKDQIDFYLDGGELNNPPSTVISLINNKYNIIRQGSYKITSINNIR